MAIFTVTTANDNGPGSLRQAIADAQSGDTIQFAPSLANQTIRLTSGQLTIPNGKNLTIDGTGVSGLTISGNQQSRIFNVESTFVSQTQFTVKNLTLTSAATTGQGGAVYANDQAQLQFDGVTFRDNVANQGGASIYTNRGSVLVNNSRFENNRATATNDERGSGGITAVEASAVTVLNSVFTGNKGINGAAINTLNSQLTVRNSQFLNNDVLDAAYASNDPNGNNFLRGYGGAIYTDRASDRTIIENSFFEGNSSRAAGGAVYLFNDPEDEVIISDTSFRTNRAIGLPQGEDGNGGALEHQRNSLGAGTLTLTDVSFVGNEANGQGGALRERNTNTTITNATIAENRVFGSDFSNNGGGIVFSGNGTANVVNSTIANNRAGWVGGGISAENSVQVNLRNSIFYQNTADNGGNPWNIQQQSNRQFSDLGGNFQWPAGNGSDNNVSSSVTIADVRLGALQQVGSLWVYPLLDGSPAINAAVSGAPPTDILGANRVGNADSGSFEFGGTVTNPVPVSISVGDVAIAEGNGTSNALVTVTLSAASNQSVSVNYGTTDGTALAGSDYTATTGTLTFTPGQTSQTISVPILGDTVVEPNETFSLSLSQPTNATIAQGQSTITLQNDDVEVPVLPTLAVSDVSVVEGNDGTTNAIFTVNLAGTTAQAVSVSYGTTDGTALAGSDYTATTGTLTFTPGQTSQTISVPILGDTVVEPNETFSLNLTAPTNATIAQGQAIGTISNDDVEVPLLPTLAVSDISVVEGNDGTTNAVFTVNLAGTTAQAVSVSYGTTDGTALAGSDYTATTGTLTFTPGQTSQTISVPILGDTVVEPNETFSLNLTAPTNATIAQGQAIGTISNDDVEVPLLPTLAVSDVSVVEGNDGTTNAVFTVNLAGTTAQAVSVSYGTTDGTALAGSDYTATTGTLTFTPGQTSQTISVPILGDTVVEPNETFSLNLTAPTNATIAQGQAIGTISNDDVEVPVLPTLAVSDVSVVEGNDGTTNAVFTVNLAGTTAQAVSVSYGTTDGTALAGSDYTATTGTLTFTPGQTSQTISIPILGDTVVEPNETFSLNLTAPTNATIAQGQAIGTISNDDVEVPVDLPSMAISNAFGLEGNEGTRNFVFKVRLSNPFSEAVTVNYATANGTAIAGSDFNSTTGTLTFNPGETIKRIEIGVIGDRTLEAIESFTVQLADPVNANVVRASGTGVVVNDDLPFLNRIAEVVAGGLSTVGDLLGNPFASSQAQAVTTLANSSLESLRSNYSSLRNIING